jgi:hypothetical protein
MSSRVAVQLAAVLCCSLAPLTANAQTAAEQFSKAASLYANPSKDGLQSFRCDVKTDWAEAFSKITGTTIAGTNPLVAALNSAPMTVDDDLKGVGQVHWDTSKVPDDAKAPIQMMQDGIQQMWHGFFQSWNGFMTGDVIAVKDDKTKVERESNGGFHVFRTDGDQTAEEHFDQNLLLTSMHVKTKGMEITMAPVFMDTPQGKLVTGMDSDYVLQAGASAAHLVMQLKYATVSGYPLPSEFHVIAGPSDFHFAMTGCVVNPVPAK